MTTTTETSTTNVREWIEIDEQYLAFNMALGLRNLAAMVEDSPEVAPLLRDMFANLMLPLNVLPNPHEALSALVHAAAQHNGDATKAKYSGVDVHFGPAVCIWVMTQMPGDLADVVADTVPPPPVDSADETPTVGVPAEVQDEMADEQNVDAAPMGAAR